MQKISKKVALKVLYWNGIAGILLICLGTTTVIRRAQHYDALIIESARQCDVDPILISAVIWKESRFQPGAIGSADEIGLMQVTEPAAREWTKARKIEDFVKHNLFNPKVNIDAGTWYLARAIKHWSRYADPIPFALAEYNAGRSNAERWSINAPDKVAFLENITFGTTKRYIEDIMQRYRGRI